MLLIHPPVVKPCEPPAGLARLAGALNHHQVQHEIVDANLESLFHRIQSPVTDVDQWTGRAVRHLTSNLEALRMGRAFDNLDRYKRTVTDINRVVQKAQPQFGGTLSLVNYADNQLSPVRSADLIRAAENPEKNPFFDWFSPRLDSLLKDRPPSLIGLSVNYLSQALCAFAMAGYVRKRALAAKIIMGGGLITSWLAGPDWRNPFEGLIDELVAGPGERPLLLSRGIESIKDHYRPDYGTFSNNSYLAPGFILPYSASRGCYWNRCSFCPESAEGHPFRPVRFEQVSADLKALITETRPVLVHLLDNALSPALLKWLCEKPIPAPWYGFARLSEELTRPGFLPGPEEIRLPDAQAGPGIGGSNGPGPPGQGDRSGVGLIGLGELENGRDCDLCLFTVRNTGRRPRLCQTDPGFRCPPPPGDRVFKSGHFQSAPLWPRRREDGNRRLL